MSDTEALLWNGRPIDQMDVAELRAALRDAVLAYRSEASNHRRSLATLSHANMRSHGR